MADYKRLVSYIYNYDTGIRKKNVGFSRVESKSGQCKVTIHITASISSQERLRVYLIHRNGQKMEGIFFGNMTVKAGTGDFRAETNSNSLMGSELSLDDISGVIVLLNENKFFGSQWDDQELKIENFSEYNKAEKENEKVDRIIEDIQVEPQNVTDMLMEEDLASQIKEPMTEMSLEAAEIDKTKPIREVVDRVVSTMKTLFPEEAEAEVVSESFEEEDSYEESESEYQTAEMEAEAGEVQDVDLETASIQEETFMQDDFIQEEENAQEIEPDSEMETIEEEPDITLEAKNIKGKCCCSDDYPECVRRVLNSFPPVKPFPDSSTEMWVRIEPKDIGMLPVETWILANNSFLLHGYYNYRHLIFGILQLESSTQYVIGVPGVLQGTEQTMAGMFGFHRFLSVNEGDGQHGNFGYRIQQIVL